MQPGSQQGSGSGSVKQAGLLSFTMSARFEPGDDLLALTVETERDREPRVDQAEVGQQGSGESPASRGYTGMQRAANTRFNLASCCRSDKVANDPNDPLPGNSPQYSIILWFMCLHWSVCTVKLLMVEENF